MSLATATLDGIDLSAWLHNVNPHVTRRRRAKTLGWRYISNGCCPLKLVGKRCRKEDCWCGSLLFDSRFAALNDHGATWRDNYGTRFVLWEPYGAYVDDLIALEGIAHRDALTVRIVGSVYYPMRTIGIAFTPATADPVWITYPHQALQK
jgi:hypothetical protein